MAGAGAASGLWRVTRAGGGAPDDRAAWLADDERRRAARFRHEGDRARFVRARLALRALLGRALGVEPARVMLVAGACGRPELAAGQGAPWFSVSHAGPDSVIALSRDGPVGVDVERDAAAVDVHAVARLCLTPGERRLLDAAGRRARCRFLALWTAKEAYAKGLGLGLARDPASFELCLVPGGFQVRDPLRAGPPWQVRSFRLGRSLIGAAAMPDRRALDAWLARSPTDAAAGRGGR